MAVQSAGILLYRITNSSVEFFIVHPGGPLWKNKDIGAWSIPKGEFTNELPVEAAKREFLEETGITLKGEFIALTPVKLKSGKIIHAFLKEGNADAEKITSNEFEMEWPPRSGKKKQFPEIDRAGWFSVDEAKQKLNPAQALLIAEAENIIFALPGKSN
jgi:predicted NUDIX family NTP pyrophosphohydrolase